MKNTVIFWLNYISTPVLSLLITSSEGWRIWVIWTGSPYVLYVIAVYIVLYLAGLGVYIASVTVWLKSVSDISGSDKDLNISIALDIALEAIITSYRFFAFCVISGRIVRTRRHITRLMSGTLSQPAAEFTGIVAILTESYAFTAIISVVLIILNTQNSSITIDAAQFVLSVINNYTAIISYYFLLYRILSGRAWNGNTAQELTTLQWARETTNFASSMAEAPPEVVTRSLPHGISAV
ncbi:hypothetical protein NP233_g1982 [Leucocoprinus birnbaumii]|uniref:Uncharacterized protein n=1 Tax=Leucocoprinus birnbaumii TaxID=56174 RepID=A0AAD5VZ10_9AGAR|nr:hypothetical protein NP233_g1982 [Leucocoprinus birnbaumii]